MNVHSLKLVYIVSSQHVNDFVSVKINIVFTYICGLKNHIFSFCLRGRKENFHNEQSFIQAIGSLPGWFMNYCRETAKMGVSPGRRLRNADWKLAEKFVRTRKQMQYLNCEFDIINCAQKSEIEAEAYLNGTSQGELVLSLSREHPRTPGRMAILFALAALRSVPQAGSQFRGLSR
jgi:hypothetical protein